MKHHPIADLFPMLSDSELDELAADIQQRGLLQPIVLDSEGHVLDGRNRLAACDLIGLEPTFTTYNGDDPGGYALAVNIARRHLTKGQRAMVMALAGYRNYTEAQVSKQYVSWARTVVDHAPDLTDGVVSGAVSLDSAYETARKNKKAADSTQTQMARLRTDAGDLADLVTEERMTLAEAVAALDERERKQKEERRDAHTLLTRALDLVAPSNADPAFIESWANHLGEVDPDTIKRIDTAIAALANLREKVA